MMTIFGILLLVMAVFLVITILLQSSRDHRLSGTIAGGAETFFGKQKGKTMDGILNKITVVVCILFFACVLLMYIFQPGSSDNTVVGGDNMLDLSDLQGLDVPQEGTDADVEDGADVVDGETADETAGETIGETTGEPVDETGDETVADGETDAAAEEDGTDANADENTEAE